MNATHREFSTALMDLLGIQWKGQNIVGITMAVTANKPIMVTVERALLPSDLDGDRVEYIKDLFELTPRPRTAPPLDLDQMEADAKRELGYFIEEKAANARFVNGWTFAQARQDMAVRWAAQDIAISMCKKLIDDLEQFGLKSTRRLFTRGGAVSTFKAGTGMPGSSPISFPWPAPTVWPFTQQEQQHE